MTNSKTPQATKVTRSNPLPSSWSNSYHYEMQKLNDKRFVVVVTGSKKASNVTEQVSFVDLKEETVLMLSGLDDKKLLNLQKKWGKENCEPSFLDTRPYLHSDIQRHHFNQAFTSHNTIIDENHNASDKDEHIFRLAESVMQSNLLAGAPLENRREFSLRVSLPPYTVSFSMTYRASTYVSDLRIKAKTIHIADLNDSEEQTATTLEELLFPLPTSVNHTFDSEIKREKNGVDFYSANQNESIFASNAHSLFSKEGTMLHNDLLVNLILNRLAHDELNGQPVPKKVVDHFNNALLGDNPKTEILIKVGYGITGTDGFQKYEVNGKPSSTMSALRHFSFAMRKPNDHQGYSQTALVNDK